MSIILETRDGTKIDLPSLSREDARQLAPHLRTTAHLTETVRIGTEAEDATPATKQPRVRADLDSVKRNIVAYLHAASGALAVADLAKVTGHNPDDVSRALQMLKASREVTSNGGRGKGAKYTATKPAPNGEARP